MKFKLLTALTQPERAAIIINYPDHDGHPKCQQSADGLGSSHDVPHPTVTHALIWRYVDADNPGLVKLRCLCGLLLTASPYQVRLCAGLNPRLEWGYHGLPGLPVDVMRAIDKYC